MKMLVSPNPHVYSKTTTSSIMLDVIVALIPATLGGIYFFGFDTLLIVVCSIASAVAAEYLYQKCTNQKSTFLDFSAVVTGLLLALNLPPHTPLWMPIIGSAFAIIIVKQLFGGIGHNFINPALAARAMLMASWATRMSSFVGQFQPVDALSSATVLTNIKSLIASGATTLQMPSGGLFNLFVGIQGGGCIGEVSEILLLLGGIYLLLRGVISFRIPVSFILTMFIMTILISPFSNAFDYALVNLFSGGLFLGAFFMATDYSSSPMTATGQIIFGIGCGLIASVIRRFGSYPEGVSYAILIMNVAAPLISKFTSPKPFGKQVVKNA